MSAGISQQFCVRWNSHLGSLGAAFPQLLAGQRFVDVTLACEGHQVHCHRLVLAACSTYFESLLGENPCKHPIIILPRDIKLWEIQALVDFMYKGEVNVSQAGLPDLLKCAEALQIRGLCGTDAALNLNHITNSTTTSASSASTTTTTNNTSLHHITATNSTANAISTTPTTNNASSITPSNATSTPCISRSASSSKVVIGPAISSPSGATTGLDVTSSTSQITNILRTELLNAATIKLSAQSTTSNASSVSRAGTSISLDDGDDSANGSGSEMNIKDEDESDLKMRVDYSDDLDGSSKLQSETVDEQQPPKNRHTPPDSQLATNRRQSSVRHQQHSKSLVPTTSPVNVGDDVVIVGGGGGGGSSSSSGGGNIRVKSNENLFENYKPSPHKTNRSTIGSDIVSKSSVPFKCSSKKASASLPPPPSLDDDSCCVIEDDDDDEYDDDDDVEAIPQPQLPSSLKYNSNTMTISVKPIKPTTKRTNQSRKIDQVTRTTDSQADANFENIICSPNLIEIPYMDDEYDVDDDMQQQDHQHDSGYKGDDADMSNATMSNSDELMPRLIPFGLLQTQFNDESAAYHDNMPKNLFASSAYRRSIGSLSMTHNNGKSFNRKILLKKGMTLLNNGGCSPSPSAVVLRNPRGNQPRTYTTDALYAALMDVKEGESIYRASQIHKVPRKTLRNWMKRWHIKSAFPMPRQLKQAAENKKMKKIIGDQLSTTITMVNPQ